uniref:PuwB n=1 Tax=Symplocastrum muelleri NIVA-CYA 644 TaxID=2303159 RepID=A0A346GB67_9CYAN|nr:PuwB [Symplocastrum muelleri NIVA-CYA 644]
MDKEPIAIAIIGIGCRFPGVKNTEAFWHLLRDGVDAIAEVPRTRWDINAFYDPDPAMPDKMNTRWGGFLEQVDQFDPQFFGISPREAASIDPQQRLLLEVAWEALEDAGHTLDRLTGRPVGVFIGISSFDYDKLRFQNPVNLDIYAGTGTTNCIAANRISYTFNLTGPSMAVDTACSSSLVAVHLACQSLWNGESTLALAGGVNMLLSPWLTVTFAKAGFLAPDGRCKAFDSRANGYVRSEGGGVVVLKPLSQALAEGDRIYAVIRGSAVNQDGRSNGLTAPNPQAQEAVIREAYHQAIVSPAHIQYIEAHGTGTKLGDPMELKALGKVLSEGRPPGKYCRVGSVKTNIGHTEAAAGIAGLIKVALSLQHKQIPPSLHFQEPNPYIPFDKLPIQVQETLEPWPETVDKALAGVSSFGFGGTNAHVVLEAAPEQTPATNDRDRPWHILTLSAKSDRVLQELAQSYIAYLQNHPEVSLAQVCFTANTGRSHFDYRLAIATESISQLQEALNTFATGKETSKLLTGQINSRKRPKIVFLFTGQGSQYIDMGRQLYETQPTFRSSLNRCNEILHPYLEKPLISVLYPDRYSSHQKLDETAYTQPALFALEYALYELWKSWGIEPIAVIGHSVGEYVAATVAEVFSLEDGLKLIAKRASLMQALPSDGAMVAVLADEKMVRMAIEPYAEAVAIAAINGSENLVISGNRQAIAGICATLEVQGIKTKPLQVSHAFHSPLMEPMLAEFEQTAKQITYSLPKIKLISNLTGQVATADIATPEYWCSHVRSPVRFAASMETLHQQGYDIFIEAGPKPILLGMGSQCLPEEAGLWLPSLRPSHSDWEQMLESLAQLYVRGIPINWLGFDRDYSRDRVALPTYPFQRQRYWIETDSNHHQPQFLSKNGAVKNLHPLVGQRLNLAGLEEICFESQISQELPAYLTHHRVFEQSVLPATAYLEMALAAGSRVFKSDNLVLENVVIQQALILPDDEAKTLQLILTPEGSTAYSFKIYSQNTEEKNDELSWICHACGKVLKGDREPTQANLASLQALCQEEISVIAYYEQCRNRGINYGESFQAIEQLFRSQELALGQIRLPKALISEVGDYKLHPVLLDACLQVLGSLLLNNSQTDIYLPIALERLQLFRHPSTDLWSKIQIDSAKDANQNTLTAEACLYTPDGEAIVKIENLQLKRTSRETFLSTPQESWQNWLYQVEWRQKARFTTQQLTADYLPTPEKISDSLHPKLTELMAQKDLKNYGEVLRQLEALSITYVSHAFNVMGWEFQLGQRFSSREIAEKLGIISQHQRLLDRLLEILVQAGILQRVDSQWEAIRSPSHPNPKTQLNLLFSQYPIAKAELTLLERCGDKLAQVLQGKCDPIQLLFPEGDLTTLTQLYQDSPGAKMLNTIIQKAVLSALEHLPKGRGVRVLEIGAGTGGTTAYILPVLPVDRTEYIFTDLTPRFTTQAQEKFRDYPFVRYQVLDIEQDLKSQGFEFHQYDLIVAANVLHATRDLRQSLQNIQQLLAPNGILILLEGTDRQSWLDLIFGLTEGWWRFADVDLRPDYPLLTASQWQELLLETGYKEVRTIADEQDNQVILSQQSVIVAQANQRQQSVGILPKNWLVMADNRGIGQQLATLLKSKGELCTLVFPGKDYEQIGEEEFNLDPANPEKFQQLLATLGTNQPSLYGVINCWSLNAGSAEFLTTPELKAASEQGCGSTLSLIQALMKTGFLITPRLWLVTQGAQPVGVQNSNVPGIAQSSLWGMGKVIALEHPELNCVRVDLDPNAVGNEAQALFEEIFADDGEDQIAFRDGDRYVARLIPYQKNQNFVIENQPYRLEISDRGTLENLTLQPTARRQPGAGEVEIQVEATGLNFRDVLNALGLYPGDPGPLGGECAGRVAAIGEGVEGFKVGDAVVAVAAGSFSQYATVNAQMVALKPELLSFEEAATIPIAFLTAYYTLYHLANISTGDRILIHAATGGVGQAAVQLAQQAGTEVFATASSSKWEFLKSMGVKHIMNSRTLDFAQQVMTLTSNQGVDIVLNSLTSEEFIAKTLSVLGNKGRFLEIAKRGAWDYGQVLHDRPDTSYFLVDLVQVCQQQPALIQSMLRQLMQQFEAGKLKPLPQKVFPIHNVVDAFRYMQQAKHIGKIIVTQTRAIPASPKPLFSRDSTYLITGGMGGLGLLVADWMVQKGVRHLVLVGRNGASSSVSNQLRELEKAGVQVVVAKADVSEAEELSQVLSEITQSLPPLRGIIHAVGVLDDGILQQQNWERFAKVMAPKVEGAWNLHHLTENLPLDFFVLFSSVASLLGSPGQANHAAANAFQDALAYYRQARGLPGLSINWGAVSEIGAAAKRQAGGWIEAKGIGTISPQQVLEVLEEQLISQPKAQVGVVPVNWSKFIQQSAPWPLFADLQQAPDRSQEQHSGFLQQLETMPAGERVAYLVAHVRSQVAIVLGMAPSAPINLQQGFFDLGMDSLTSVELRNRLQTSLECSLPATLAFKYPTVEALADYLATEVFAFVQPTRSEEATQKKSQAQRPDLAEIKQFSPAEVEDALTKEIEELESLLRGE